jgi:glyoxylase-like metal-dependent hydrolase (beta-lactamase superfamily II)
MRHRKVGKLTDSLWYLGREETGVYLMECRNEAMLISGGMGYILPDVLAQMKAFGIDAAKISKALILHAHFDHVGIIPWFKRTWPGIEILASARAWELLKMPKAIQTINSFSRMVNERMGLSESLAGYDFLWRDDLAGSTVSEGDRIDLGGLSVEILETPGHSSCSVSAYEPSLQALFPSDAGGIPLEDVIIPLGNSNFTQFQESLAKLASLPVSFFCADHYGYITGSEAVGFIAQTIEAAKQFRMTMEDSLQKYGDTAPAARHLTEEIYRRHPDYFMSPEVTEMILGQMFRHIAKKMVRH